EPIVINLKPHLETTGDIGSFLNSDLLILNIPSRVKDADIVEYHPKQIQSVIRAIKNSSINRVVFVSSTAVYPAFGEAKEGDSIQGKASRPSGEALLIAEDLLFKNNSFKTTVLRFG